MAEVIASTKPVAPPVVVGVSDDDSRAAVQWAASEAVDRGVELVVVHVTDEPPRWSVGRQSSGNTALAEAAPATDVRNGRRVLHEVVQQLAVAHPGLVVRTNLVSGDVAPVLGALSERAALVVIGGRRQALGRAGHLAGILGGHGRAPLVVVHADDHFRSGPVVVGVDMGPESAHALDMAFEQAARMHVPLRIVHAVQRPAADASSSLLTSVPDIVTAEREVTHSLVGGVHADYPEVEVDEQLVEGSAAQAIIENAADASMIVVGSHGRSTLAALLLGSVSRTLVGRAPCPVAVVPGF